MKILTNVNLNASYYLWSYNVYITCEAVEKKVPANFPDKAPVAHSLPVASKSLINTNI